MPNKFLFYSEQRGKEVLINLSQITFIQAQPDGLLLHFAGPEAILLRGVPAAEFQEMLMSNTIMTNGNPMPRGFTI